ncbi:hypothetical protein C8J57DRAFT_1229977 [Mycena rebaudengoi]|nr:hypothetical protein C8J57DRAFT_1229977 [Mycena rebaudengoi]
MTHLHSLSPSFLTRSVIKIEIQVHRFHKTRTLPQSSSYGSCHNPRVQLTSFPANQVCRSEAEAHLVDQSASRSHPALACQYRPTSPSAGTIRIFWNKREVLRSQSEAQANTLLATMAANLRRLLRGNDPLNGSKKNKQIQPLIRHRDVELAALNDQIRKVSLVLAELISWQNSRSALRQSLQAVFSASRRLPPELLQEIYSCFVGTTVLPRRHIQRPTRNKHYFFSGKFAPPRLWKNIRIRTVYPDARGVTD